MMLEQLDVHMQKSEVVPLPYTTVQKWTLNGLKTTHKTSNYKTSKIKHKEKLNDLDLAIIS